MHATDTAALKPSRSSSTTFVCQLILLSHLRLITLIIILTDVEIEVSVTQRVKKFQMDQKKIGRGKHNN